MLIHSLVVARREVEMEGNLCRLRVTKLKARETTGMTSRVIISRGAADVEWRTLARG